MKKASFFHAAKWVVLFILFSACTSTPYDDTVISSEELEGVWKGYAESHLSTTRVMCTIKLPLVFTVNNGRAVSLCDDPKCAFDVPVDEKGMIRFKYRKILKYTSDYGATEMRDINFVGQLSSAEGKGTFASGGCVGKWQVYKNTQGLP